MFISKRILTSHSTVLFTALFISISFLLILESCATAGYENVDTTRKAILVANAELRGANLLLQDLIHKDLISNRNAQKTLDDIRTAHGYLQAALYAITMNNDTLQANSRLQRANVYLSNITTLLAQFTEEP